MDRNTDCIHFGRKNGTLTDRNTPFTCLRQRIDRKIATGTLLLLLLLCAPFANAVNITHANSLPIVEQAVAPVLSVETEKRLIVRGSTTQTPVEIAVTPRNFVNTDALYDYLNKAQGATMVYDKSGKIVGARGKYRSVGRIQFIDNGQRFAQSDYIAAILGGADGIFTVGRRTINLKGEPSTSRNTNYFSQTQHSCDGDQCISGHTWLTHIGFPINYHSFGVRTTQTSGGTRENVYYSCLPYPMVTISGERKCRVPVRNSENCERIEGTHPPQWVCTEQEYSYTDPLLKRRTVWDNELAANARILSNTGEAESQLSDRNVPEVEQSEWSIFVGHSGAGPVPLAEITGVCGRHVSTAGAEVRTSDGNTGYDVDRCAGPF